jgi:hypothetical protein
VGGPTDGRRPSFQPMLNNGNDFVLGDKIEFEKLTNV